MLVLPFLCGLTLIARGLISIHCGVCGEDSFILESGIINTNEAQPATCGNREDLLYENHANITYNYSSPTLPALPEHIRIEVNFLEVNYILVIEVSSSSILR